jgi:2-dehydropantoate 2-reductase
MRQVPPHYLLIGNGRVARHLQHYFSLLDLPFITWHRGEMLADLQEKVLKATHILVLISDRAIDEFIKTHLSNSSAFIIHCSGALICERAYGVHPLMTFGHKFYEFSDYLAIPFVLDEHAPAFETLLPGVPNPHQRLATSLKTKYHALCVLSGNFTCMLWQKLFNDFVLDLKLAPELAHPYLERQMQNLLEDPEKALTGPVVRGDTATIAKNLEALADDPFQDVYKSFVRCYQQIKESV